MNQSGRLSSRDFDQYRASLIAVIGRDVDFIKCPLCMREVTRREVTIEHIVPGSLGGRLTTLTCRECNNTAGSQLEAHWTGMIKAAESLAGSGEPVSGRIRSGAIDLPVRFAWGGEDNPTILTVPGGPPESVDSLMNQMLSAGDRQTDLHLTLNLGYKVNNARRAMVRCAYLGLFRELGYPYVFSQSASFVRELIAGSHAESLELFTPDTVQVQCGGASPLALLDVWKDGLVVAYLALIRSVKRERRDHAVILPGSNVPGSGVVSLMSSLVPCLHRQRLVAKQGAVRLGGS